MIYQTVELFHDAVKQCEKISEELIQYSEMTAFQHDFLCGMLKQKRPKKILEIGVSAGGTTGIVLSCLQLMGLHSEMYSVDISGQWYRSDKKGTGFIAKKYMSRLKGNVRHEFLLGESIPHVIEKIGGEIDFLILDTTHSLPGELLDFLVCFPYLQKGCIVALHDVIESSLTCRDHEIATKLLFDLVEGNKWYMSEDALDTFGFSNIAAFETGEETKEKIYRLFSGLAMPWQYMPEDREAKKYIESIKQNYTEEQAAWLERIFALQRYVFVKKGINAHYGLNHDWLKAKWEKQKNVFLYGGGHWARVYSEYAKTNRLPLNGWIISDEEEMVTAGEYNVPVCHLSDLPYGPDECAIILALDRRYYGIIKKNLMDKGYYRIL